MATGGRNYSSTARPTVLVSTITDTATSISVGATTGFPAAPFILAIEPGAVNQELVLVTNVSGTTLTVTRGVDSTTAVAHGANSVVQHTSAALDFREAMAIATDSGWQLLSYFTNWADYGAAGYEKGRYRKIGNEVKVAGFISPSVSLTASTYYQFATMPVGYRPASDTISYPAVSGAGLAGRVMISSNGVIQWISAGSVASGGYVIINGSYFID